MYKMSNTIKMNNLKRMLVLCAAILPTTMVFALEALDEQSMSATTGQDGINIGIGIEKVNFEQASLIDKNGIATKLFNKEYNTPAAFVLAGASKTPVSVSFIGANSSTPTINMVLDTDAGNGNAFANAAISFGSQITGIKVSPFALYLASTNSVSSVNSSKSIYNSTTLNAGVSKVLEIGSASNNFEISFNNTNRPQMNVQLGSVPQGQLIQFSGAIQAICGTGTGCPIALISEDTSAKFDFQMKATDATNGFVLDGFYAGIEATGLVIGNKGTSSKMNVAMNNVMLGREATSSGTVFNGLSNGSMGSFGAIGASVKDLKVSVRGL